MAHRVLAYLVDREQYHATRMPSDLQVYPGGPTYASSQSVHRLSHPHRRRSIDLIESKGWNPTSNIVTFHTTLVVSRRRVFFFLVRLPLIIVQMNYFTADRFVSLHPRLTLRSVGMVTDLARTDASFRQCLVKYCNRGEPFIVSHGRMCGVLIYRQVSYSSTAGIRSHATAVTTHYPAYRTAASRGIHMLAMQRLLRCTSPC